jgi:hypothetical protein
MFEFGLVEVFNPGLKGRYSKAPPVKGVDQKNLKTMGTGAGPSGLSWVRTPFPRPYGRGY